MKVTSRNVYGSRDLPGTCSDLPGTCSDLTGTCSDLTGTCSDLTGTCSDLPRACSDPSGTRKAVGGTVRLMRGEDLVRCDLNSIMPNSGCQLTSSSACNRRQRKRKLSNPQRRRQHIDSKEDEQETGTCSLRHTPYQNPHAGFIDVGSGETTDESLDTTDPRFVKSERVVGDTEDTVDSIKKEAIHEFIVDGWYDLGPIPHYTYSPGSSPESMRAEPITAESTRAESMRAESTTAESMRAESMRAESITAEKMEVNENTADSHMDNNGFFNEPAECSKPKLANKRSNITPSGHKYGPVKGMQIPVSTQAYLCPNREGISGSTEAAQGKKPYKVTDVAGPNGVTAKSVFPPVLGYQPPTTGHSFTLQQSHSPLSVEAASPYFHIAATENPAANETANNNSMAPRHSYSCMPSLGISKPDIIYPHVRPVYGLPNQCSQNYNTYSKTDQLLTTTSATPCPLRLSSMLPNSTPYHSPTVASHFLAPSCARCEEAVDHREFLYSDNLYRRNSCHSSGAVLVPSHPYYVQPMPFVPLIPKVSCNHLHVEELPSCPKVNLGNLGSDPTPQVADRNPKTPTGNSATSLLEIPIPRTASALLTETGKSRPIEDKQATGPGPASQHPVRVKVKPRRADSTDFIDPTRIKLSVDDDDAEEDLSKLNDLSDSSDTEWQPRNRDLKPSHRRDSEGGNGWAPKNDGFTHLDSSVKRKYCRRRQRSSKELAECSECGKVFKGSYYLCRHQMSHSDIRPFQCSICHKCFKQKAHLIGHQSIHERAVKLFAPDGKPLSPKFKPLVLGCKCPGRPKKAYTEKDRACRECGKIFKTVYRLKRHELSHTDLRPFSCRICGKAFKQTGHRNEHEANHETTKKRFLCNMCGVVFRCRSSFNNHMRSHGMEKLRLQTARSDVDSACGDGMQATSEDGHTGYDCPYCTEKFATAQALNSHLETHVEVHQRRHVQPYSCDVCRRAFTYRHNLVKHKLIHKAPDKFAQFYKDKFEAHLASGKPSFNCTKCDKVFIRKETLAKHYKIHTGSKPFKCDICSHEFTQNVHLKVHMRKHTGSRPFQCKECSRSFIDSTALAKHIEYEACNTDNCLYHCKLCDKMHYYLGSLKKHIRKRHGAKDEEVEKYIIKSERSSKRTGACGGEKYPCKVCCSSFSEKCNLVRHIKRKHAVLVELLQKELEGKHAMDVVDESSTSDAVNRSGDLKRDRKLAVVAQHPLLLCNALEPDLAASRKADISCHNEVSSEKLQGGNPSCEEFNSPDVVGRSQLNPEGVTPAVSAEKHEVLRSTATQEAVNISERPKSVFEAADGTGLLAENDRTRSPLKHKTKESLGGFLEGFHSSDLEFSEKQLGNVCAHEQFSCKKLCLSREQVNNSPLSDLASVQPEECITSANKYNNEEDCSSPTDIHFLYKIGLIVSSKGKVPGTSAARQSRDTLDKEWSCNPLCSSLTGLGHSCVSADNPTTHGQLYREEYQNQTPHLTCHRSRSFSFLDGTYNDRADAITTTDDSCSLGFIHESKQVLNPIPLGSSCDELINSHKIYNMKHNLQVIETRASRPQHLGSEIKHHPSEVDHEPSEIEQEPNEVEHHTSELEHHFNEIEHHPSEIEHHPSEIEQHLGSEIKHHPSEVDHEPSEIEQEPNEVEHHTSELEHHFNEIEHHPSEIEHHPREIKHHPSEIKHHPREIEHHPNETEHHPAQAEHHSSEIDRRPAQTEHHSSEIDRRPAQAEHHSSEIDRHPAQAEHHSSEIDRHPAQAEHHSSEIEHSRKVEHRANKTYFSLKCTHNSQNTSKRYTYESDNRFMVPNAAECDKQIGNVTECNNLCMSDTSALPRLDTGEIASVVTNRSKCDRLPTECARLGPNISLGKVFLTAVSVGTLLKGGSTITCVVQSCTARHQEQKGGQPQPGERVGAPSRVSVLIQRDSDAGNMRIISPDLKLNLKNSCVVTAKPGLSLATSVETVTAELGKSPPGAIRSRRPSPSLSEKSLQTTHNDSKHDDLINKTGDILSRPGKPTYSLIHKATKDKTPNSLEYLPFDEVSNSVDPNVHSKNVSRSFRSHKSAIESSNNDYEACPTESHLQYLGLLACKDAQEIKNRSTPIKDLYQMYKPWLEELIRSNRPRRSRIGVKWSATTRGLKNTSSTTTTTVAEQLTYLRHNSERTENKMKLGESSACGTADSAMKAVVTEQTSVSQPGLTTPTWSRVESGLGEMHTDPDECCKMVAETGSRDSEFLLTSGHTSRSSSPTVQQLVTTSAPSATAAPTAATSATTTAASATTKAVTATANTHQEDQHSTVSEMSALSSGEMESVAGCAESSSPPSTPDSTVRGKHVYVCLVCNKYFTARHQLKRHAMTHTDHRPFTCEKCGRAFRQKVHLSDHVKRHQGQRPFVCAGCGKRFVLKNEMNQHIKNHCRGSLDVFKNMTLVSDKRVLQVAATEGSPLPGPGEVVTQPAQQGQDCMLMIGQCYRAGDIISNGTITLKVIESAYQPPIEKRHTSAHPIDTASPLKATCSQTTDCCISTNRCHDDLGKH